MWSYDVMSTLIRTYGTHFWVKLNFTISHGINEKIAKERTWASKVSENHMIEIIVMVELRKELKYW